MTSWRQVLLIAAAAALVCSLGVMLANSGAEREDQQETFSPFDAFDAWRVRARAASQPLDATFVSEGVELARARSAALSALVVSDPAAAAVAALSPGARAFLPAAVRAHVEAWRTGDATVEVLCAFPKPAARANVTSNGQAQGPARARGAFVPSEADHSGAADVYTYRVHFAATNEAFTGHVYGRRVLRAHSAASPLMGFALGDRFVVADALTRVMDADDIAAAAAGLLGDGVTMDAAALARASRDGAVTLFSAARVAPHALGADGLAAQPQLDGTVTVFASAAAADAYTAAIHTAEDAHFATHFVNSKTLEEISIIVFFVQFADEAAPCSTQTAYQPTMTKQALYWLANSYRQSTYATPVYENILVSGTKASYAAGGVCPQDNGKTAVLDNEVWSLSSHSEASFDRYMILFSEYSECQWAGLGSIAASGTWINGLFDPVDHWHIAAHELGHNYGLKHANLWYGGGLSPVGVGQSLSYGDDYDIMGAVTIETDRFTFHANAEKKAGLDWIPATDVTTLTVSPANSGQYRVFVMDSIDVSSGNRALKIQRGPASTTYYWVEFRQAIAYAPSANYFKYGATIHWAYELSSFATETDLLDMTPSYVSTDLYDTAQENAALALGRTFNDPDVAIHITPLGISALNGAPYLDVYVSFDAANSAPSVPTLTSSCAAPAVGESVLLRATATDPNNDLLAYNWDFGDGSVPTSASLAVTHKWTTVGAKTVTVVVSDLRGSTSTATLTTITVGAVSECPDCPNACSNRGLCSGGVCRCSPGYTSADCSVRMTVTAVVPNYGPLTGGVAVTLTGTGFPVASPSYVCQFQGLGTRSATYVSSTQVICLNAPSALSKQTVVLEASPDGGIDATNSKLTYTIGGGFCLNNCSARGTCDVGPGVCSCFAGFTGDDCSVGINVTLSSPIPSEGPSSGGTQVVLFITAGASAFSSSTSACRFGATNMVPATLSTAPGPVTLTCLAPAYLTAAVLALTVEASPNGIDVTNSAVPFTYRPVVELYEGLTTAAQVIASANSYAYFFFTLGDVTGADLRVQLAVSSGAPTLRARSNVVPVPADMTSTVEQVGPGTMTLQQAALANGVIYFSVFSGAGPATVTLTLTANSALALAANGSAISGFTDTPTTGALTYFTFEHTGIAHASVVVVDVLNPGVGSAPTLYLSSSAARPSATESDASGTSVALQYCQAPGTFYVAVSGTNTLYAIRLIEVSPPAPGQLADKLAGELDPVVRTESSVLTRLEYGTDGSSYDFGLEYSLFYVKNNIDLEFATPCDVRANGVPFRTGVLLDPFNTPSFDVAPLDSASNYQFAVIVRSPLGVEQTYLPLLAKTKPPPIPRAIIYGLAGGCIATALVAGSIVAFFRLRKKSKKHRKGRRRRKSRRSQAAVAAGLVPGEPTLVPMPDPRRGGGRQGGPRFQGARGVGATPTPRPRERGAGAATALGGPPGTPARAPASASAPVAAPAAAPVSGRASARGDFTAQYPNELSFKKGDVLVIHDSAGAGWLRGELDGRIGLVPASFVKMLPGQ